jgi:Zn-dependent protease
MTSYLLGLAIKVLLLAPPILLALTVHEASHALVAWLRGDNTAKDAGRLSLNPIRHLDVAGTLVFFVTAWVGSGIGWAKPVPVDYRRLKNPRRDIIWISAAGPLANLSAACLMGLLLHLLVGAGFFREPTLLVYYLGQLFILGVQVNLMLAMFNLLPLPPPGRLGHRHGAVAPGGGHALPGTEALRLRPVAGLDLLAPGHPRLPGHHRHAGGLAGP